MIARGILTSEQKYELEQHQEMARIWDELSHSDTMAGKLIRNSIYGAPVIPDTGKVYILGE